MNELDWICDALDEGSSMLNPYNFLNSPIAFIDHAKRGITLSNLDVFIKTSFIYVFYVKNGKKIIGRLMNQSGSVSKFLFKILCLILSFLRMTNMLI